MTERWSISRRVAFRFGVVAGALYLFPFPLNMLPKTDGVVGALSKPWDWAVPWFSELLGLGTPQNVPTGSGDTLFYWVQALLIVVLAAIGAGVWSVIDRRRLAYPRLQAGAIVVLRYFLCAVMLGYGVAKLVAMGQFPEPSLGRLDQTYGESSPMGLLWTFMGHSQAYTMFGGIGECVGGLLLLSRRTTVVGALVLVGVLTNVVMLNFCYDVPVKLFSSQLLLCAILILLPHARRVGAALLGYAMPEVAPRARGSTRAERVRLVAKIAFVACVVYAAYGQFSARTMPPKNALHGTWVVETFAADGVEQAPLITDKLRWRKVIVTEWSVQLRTMTDERLRFGGAKVDPAARTITFVQQKGEAKSEVVLFYQRDGKRLVLDGEFEGRKLHVTLALQDEALLTSRGFHWVQEFPFNR